MCTNEASFRRTAIRQASNRSASMSIQQNPQLTPSSLPAQLNSYSAHAATLFASMDQTPSADSLLEKIRGHKRARRMFIDEDLEALVTTENTAICQVVHEVVGHVSMPDEVKRQPGGGNQVFLYDGLMRGTTCEGRALVLVCIDTKQKGNDTKFTMRSCKPNSVLKHVLGSNATLGIVVVATKDILRNQVVTLPFDDDWKDCDVKLKCYEHMREMHLCPLEQERRRFAEERVRD